MDLRKIKSLIDLVSESDITELEITENEGKVRIVKARGAQPQAGLPLGMLASAGHHVSLHPGVLPGTLPFAIPGSPVVGSSEAGHGAPHAAMALPATALGLPPGPGQVVPHPGLAGQALHAQALPTQASHGQALHGQAGHNGIGAAAEAVDTAFVVKSPMVGTFYRASQPGADPFVQVGSKVSETDVVCLIEAMKLLNEIEAGKAGSIKAVLVENGQPVEYGQPLFLID